MMLWIGLGFLFGMFARTLGRALVLSITTFANIHVSVGFSLIGTAAFPSYLIAPPIFAFSLRRYRSNRSDYAFGFGVVTVACLLIVAAFLSHVLATTKGERL